MTSFLTEYSYLQVAPSTSQSWAGIWRFSHTGEFCKHWGQSKVLTFGCRGGICFSDWEKENDPEKRFGGVCQVSDQKFAVCWVLPTFFSLPRPMQKVNCLASEMKSAACVFWGANPERHCIYLWHLLSSLTHSYCALWVLFSSVLWIVW